MRPQYRWLAGLAAVFLSTSAFAQARINAVSYDLVSGALVITGEDLKISAGATTVKLGGTTLSVSAATATSVTAQLPVNQGAGEYLIFLKRAANVLEAAPVGEASYSLSIIQPTPGPQGPEGPEGPQGPAGVSGYITMTATSALDSTESKILAANCPAGKMVLGGGQLISPVSAANYRSIAVPTSRPTLSNTGWQAAAIEVPVGYATNWQLVVYAICATAAP